MLDNHNASFPNLTTERLRLRQLRSSDDQEIFALRSDQHVNKYLDRKPAGSIDDARSFIDAIIQHSSTINSVYWAITRHGSDKLIGTICLFNFSEDRSKLELGFELSPEFQGAGIMHEAVQAVLDYAFEKIHAKRIEACTHAENSRSIGLLEKLGFERQIHDEKHTILSFRLAR